MCGIAGVVGFADRKVIAAMTNAQAHRGPDDSGIWVAPAGEAALGHRRLSIIDLSPAGHQPMANGGGDLWITYNGEIYNYLEVRRTLSGLGFEFKSNSDTEVLLAAYEAWGEKCLDQLNGMFAFAIYDLRNKRLFAARDRLGIKPFYYYYGGGILAFASEIKGLLACPVVPRRPDLAVLATPARFQISPYTGFENILKLPPGHSLTYVRGELRIRQYWNLNVADNAAISEGEALEQLDHLLRDSVRLQMIADVPVGVLLSGGLDSSIISALMRQYTQQDIHAFTIRFSDKDQRFEQMPDDSLYARKVAQQLGFKYHEIEIEPDIDELFPKLVWHLDEPLSDPAAINTYLISRAAREQNIVVLLNGMGGDEVFGGYRKQLACLKADAYQRFVPSFVRSAIESGFEAIPVATSKRGLRTLRWAKRFASFASLDQFDRYLASDLSLSNRQYERLYRGNRDYTQSHFYIEQRRRFDSLVAPYLTKMCLNDTKVFLPEHNLLYSDKASMAAGIEGRPPLIDHRIVEFMFTLPTKYRIRGNVQKSLLKRVGERYLPRDIVHRPKAPFGSPLRSWIRGPLAPKVDELLDAKNMRSAELYDVAKVHELIARDRAGLEDNALPIWTVLTTELWFRTFFA